MNAEIVRNFKVILALIIFNLNSNNVIPIDVAMRPEVYFLQYGSMIWHVFSW